MMQRGLFVRQGRVKVVPAKQKTNLSRDKIGGQ